MAVSAGEVCRADVRGIVDGTQALQNVFHLRNEGSAIAEADAVDDIVELLEAMYALISAILHVVWVVQNVRIINVSDDTDVGTGLFTDTSPGTATGNFAPQNGFGLVLDTPRLASKGRKFFGPCVAANFGVNGIIGAGALADLADVGDYLEVAQVATNNTWRFGVFSTIDGVGFLPFVSYGISPTLVTQRRRRIGVGI